MSFSRPPAAIKPAFTQNYTSSQTAIGTSMTFAHGLGTVPKLIQVYGVCVSADAGYSVGDKVLFNNASAAFSANSTGLSVAKDATNVVVTVGVTRAQMLINAADGTLDYITNADWKMVVEAWA